MTAHPDDPPAAAPAAPFALDPFQEEAVAALGRGHSVLVSAPTGSGKTVVAEHAVDLALAHDAKAFYTTPIKALSNQKYHDLAERLGADRVGLLTGDTSVNGDAPVVVMTTEVLRNMLYAGSPALDGLRWVVLDEVHFLQDTYRGPVWEEVMIHLPPEVRLVCLSATVSNAEELRAWIETVRGRTEAVVEERRPVELVNHYAVENRSAGELAVIETLVDGGPNPAGRRFDVTEDPGRGRRGNRRRWGTPHRLDLLGVLEEERLLPAIWFVFSRAGCDDAAAACLRAGVRLAAPGAAEEIRRIAEAHVAGLDDTELAVLGYERWLAALEAGIASHHAGLVPPFKEAVEECFAGGLVPIVFATETLALGINMPARTVVIDKLTKYNGERHERLTPVQYTQLTGRAGRRGLDPIGHAVVLWSPWVRFDDVAELAASRSFELRSAFRPTYNMAANLVGRVGPEEAHRLLNLSFAQFQADRTVVRLEQRLARREDREAALRAEAACELGDVAEYAGLVADDRRQRRVRRQEVNDEVRHGLGRLRPGDVLWLAGGKNGGPVAVVSVSHRRGGAVRLRALTPRRRVLNLGPADFAEPPVVVGRIELPTPFAPGSAAFQKEVAAGLARLDVAPSGTDGRGPGHSPTSAGAHPVASCPDRDHHLRAQRDADRVAGEVRSLRRRIESHTGSLARTFDRVLQLLEAWGYLDGWSLTDRGALLAGVFHESDLLVAECIAEGLLDGLDEAALAGVVSCLSYEHRSPTPPPEPWFPDDRTRTRVDRLRHLAEELAADEVRAGLPITRAPDPTFLPLAHAWVLGLDLDEVLAEEDLAPGDFVRTAKLVVDLLGQVADVAPDPATAGTARRAAEAMFRGVVAVSSAPAGPIGDGGTDAGAPGGAGGRA